MNEVGKCIECGHSKVTGDFVTKTLVEPAEEPDVECGYDGEGDIDKFEELLDMYVRLTPLVLRERKDFIRAKFCPFYKNRVSR